MRLKLVKILIKTKLSFLLLFLFRLWGCKFDLHISRNNSLSIRNAVLYKSKITANGRDNCIKIGDDSFIESSHIKIVGNRNKISIGDCSFANQLMIIVEGDDNEIQIGQNFFVCGSTKLYVVDGSKLAFGNDCMLSDNIEIRTTDNHGIFDMATGKRINPEENIRIGNHVWVGMGATILKGSMIPNGCIIGAKSIITKSFTDENTCIVGQNKIVKRNVTWTMERKPSL